MNKGWKLLLILLFAATSWSCALHRLVQPREAVYLLPEAYTGPVVILFDQPDGVVPQVENGFTVYRIPESGVLKVNKKANYKIYEERYFYEMRNQERVPIDYIYPTVMRDTLEKDKKTYDQIAWDDPSIYVVGGEMGSFNTRTGIVRYRAFSVGIRRDGEKLAQQKRNKIVELQKGLQ